MLIRLRALVALLLLAACDPNEVGPELEAAIALAITGSSLGPFSTATVTARGPVTKSVTGGPGEKVEITGLPPGTYAVTVRGFSGGELVWADQTTVTVTAGATTTATVSASYELTLSGSGTGNGMVRSNPTGITCTITVGSGSGTCSTSLNSGTTVALIATPAAGHTFAGWSGACTGTGTCEVIMNQTRSVRATFTAPVDPDAEVTITSISPNPVLAGDTVTISYRVENTGNVAHRFVVGSEVRQGTSVVSNLGTATTPTISQGISSSGSFAYGVSVEPVRRHVYRPCGGVEWHARIER